MSMTTKFERDYHEFLTDVVVGEVVQTLSSEGDLQDSWTTHYEVQGVIQMRTGRREEIAGDTYTSMNYLILLPLETSSGGTVTVESGYRVYESSDFDYSEDKADPVYEINEYLPLLDYCLSTRATRVERS